MKKIAAILLSVLLLSACSANSVTKSDYEVKITDLETKITALTTQVETLTATLTALQLNIRDGYSYHILPCEYAATTNTTECYLPALTLAMSIPGKSVDRIEILENITKDTFGVYYHNGASFDTIIQFKAINSSQLSLANEYAGATTLMDLGSSRILISLITTPTLTGDDLTYVNTNNFYSVYSEKTIKFTIR